MLAIAAAGAFVGLFVLWVVLPRKLLKNRKPRTPRTPRPVRGRAGSTPRATGDGPGAATLSAPGAD